MTDAFGWRAAFGFQVPLLALALASGLRNLNYPVVGAREGESTPEKLRRIDFAGCGLIFLSCGSFLVSLSLRNNERLPVRFFAFPAPPRSEADLRSLPPAVVQPLGHRYHHARSRLSPRLRPRRSDLRLGTNPPSQNPFSAHSPLRSLRHRRRSRLQFRHHVPSSCFLPCGRRNDRGRGGRPLATNEHCERRRRNRGGMGEFRRVVADPSRYRANI